MTSRCSGGWLEAVLVRAQDAGWCMRPYCTTCGCLEFRRSYWAAAARQAGVAIQLASPALEFLVGLSAADREVLVRTLVAGLRALPPTWSGSEALRTIIIDLDPPLILHGVWMALGTELSGSPAGDVWAEMHAAAEMAERRRAYESPQAVAARRLAKREKRAIAHAARQSESRRRNIDRAELLAALARLSAAERLARFATDAQLTLDCVPADLIPSQESDLMGMERAMAVALLRRIGQRKGAWGRLRRVLKHLLRGEPE